MRDIIYKTQDLRHLSWDERAVTSGTGGTFLKSKLETSRGPIYYKLSRYDRYMGIIGHESVNEVIASRLLDILYISHVPYKLVHAIVNVDGKEHETWLSESRDYRLSGERRQQFDTYYDLYAERDVSPLDFAISQGWEEQIFQMLVIDYLIINRDRHGANIEVVFRDSKPYFSPLYDHGLSFVCNCCNDERAVRDFDPMYDRKCNNYIGSTSVEHNLQFVPKELLTVSRDSDAPSLALKGIERILPVPHLEKIEEIIRLRWNRLLDLGIIGVERS